MSVFLGMRGTGDFTVTGQRPENWREMILYLYPNGKAPLTAIMSMMKSEKTDDPIFHWFEKELDGQRVDVTALHEAATLDNAWANGEAKNAGDTIYAYTEILDVIDVNREDIGLLRLRTIGLKNVTPKEVSNPKGEDGKYLPNVVLDLDYTVIIPKKKTQK